MKITLASTSVIRTTMLSGAGVSHDVVRPAVDEDQLKVQLAGSAPGLLSHALAHAKAMSVSAQSVDDLVIGADQVLECDGQLFNKPANISDAKSQLLSLRGKTHRLISSLSVCQCGKERWSTTDTARLSVRNFSDAFLMDYLAKAGADVTTSVGGYKIEGLGIQLFESIEGDHTTILGMPLLPLLNFLRSAGAIAQ